MADITMPQLGETVTEGTITRWAKNVGDRVEQVAAEEAALLAALPTAAPVVIPCREPLLEPYRRSDLDEWRFGLNPAARIVLNSVFLNECVNAGLDSAIVHASKILPMARIPDEQRQVALDMVYDRRRPGYDPLQKFMELFEGVDVVR